MATAQKQHDEREWAGKLARSKMFRARRKTFPFISWKLRAAVRISSTNTIDDELELTVKVLPFVFALIPLAAVVSACVSTY